MKTNATAHPARRASRSVHASRLALASASLLLIAAALWLSSAHAQTAAPAAAPANTSATAAADTVSPAVGMQVGDATRSLLEKQRAGTFASDTPRPIAGEVAQRSYERYLRSFERPIPENFTTVASPAAKTAK